jgi:hypothetical protein
VRLIFLKGAWPVLLVSAAFSPLGAVANVTPISSSIILHAEADAGTGLIQDDQSQTQTTTLNGLSASVFAQSVNGTKKDSSRSSASATWASASTGQFSIDTKFTSDNLSSVPNSRVATGSPGWFYSFSSDLPATLTLNYNIAHTGPFSFGSTLDINQSLSNNLVRQVQFAVPSSGSLTFSISPDTNYTFQVFDNSNLNSGLPSFTSEMIATFSYQITPVPEPSAFALGVLGLVALLILRRRPDAAR